MVRKEKIGIKSAVDWAIKELESEVNFKTIYGTCGQVVVGCDLQSMVVMQGLF